MISKKMRSIAFLVATLAGVALLSQNCGFRGDPNLELSSLGSWSIDPHDSPSKVCQTKPGHVPLRRLNNAEYRNSVRDIFGFTQDPTVDLPLDDIGPDGFANNSIVQTLSPDRLEAYLGAAQETVAAAFDSDSEVLHCGSHSSPPMRITASESFVFTADGDSRRPGAEAQKSSQWMVFEIPASHFKSWYNTVTVRARGAVVSGAGPILEFHVNHQKQAGGLSVSSAADGELSIQYEFVPGFIFENGIGYKIGFRLENALADGSRAVAIDSIEFSHQAAAGQSAEQAAEMCPNEVLSRVARRAWRRPVSAEELSGLTGVMASARAAGATAREALAVALQGVFLSPRFLYLNFSTADSGGQLDGFALASRLSYFLWNSTPDETLLQLAEQGKLLNAETVKSQIKRLLADPRSRRFAKTFASQWLGLDKLLRTSEVSGEGLTDALRVSMKTETEMFIEAIIAEDRSLIDIMEADFTFLNGTLANHYGIAGVSGEDFQRVNVAAAQRKGLLSQGSILTITSGATESKPTGRGNFILNSVTCSPPPPFPDGGAVTPLGENDPNLTIREKLEIHRSSASCIGCHVQMDSIGLGLEHFDQLGRFRERYESTNHLIDASGELNGGRFTDHRGLATTIARQDSYGQCMTRKLMAYAIGRSLERTGDDKCVVDTIAKVKVSEDSTFSDFLTAVVLSDLFLMNDSGN